MMLVFSLWVSLFSSFTVTQWRSLLSFLLYSIQIFFSLFLLIHTSFPPPVCLGCVWDGWGLELPNPMLDLSLYMLFLVNTPGDKPRTRTNIPQRTRDYKSPPVWSSKK